MLRTSKQERDALFAARRKLADALSFLRSKGFSEEQIFDAQNKDGFGSKPMARDEFGLPVATKKSFPSRGDFGLPDIAGKVDSSSKNGDPFTDKLKGKVDENIADAVLDEKPKTGSLGSGNVKDPKPKLWKWVRKTPVNPPSEHAPHHIATSSVPHPAPAKECPEFASPVKGSSPTAGIDTLDCSDNSATPTNTFKNLRNVDEKDLKQKNHPDAEGFRPSKSQRKRLKRAQGKSPNNPS
ncbi:hypothetical protein ACET3Z_028195 [Daucus carota]